MCCALHTSAVHKYIRLQNKTWGYTNLQVGDSAGDGVNIGAALRGGVSQLLLQGLIPVLNLGKLLHGAREPCLHLHHHLLNLQTIGRNIV